MTAMFLQRCSSIAIARARCYASTTSPISTSHSVISKHIQDLSKKHDHLLQMRRDLRGVKIQNLNPVQRELFESHPRVLHHLNFLQKFYKEIAPAVVNLDGSTADAPITLTSSVPVIPTSHSSQCPVSIIFKELLDLHQQCVSISQIEQSLYSRLSQQTTAQMGFHCTKFFVMHEINVLSKVFEEITWEIELDCSRNAEPSRGDFGDQLNPVMLKSSRLAEIITSDHSIIDTTPMLQNLGLGPSMKKEMDFESEPLEKNRYLLVSNGCEIYCLDLNQIKYHPSLSDCVPLLPIIATLNLLEENLPTTVGLFKWRSNAYMIGGQMLPKALKDCDDSCIEDWGENPQGIKLYKALCWTNRVKPTSCLIHGLSLDGNKISLSHSESNMGKLKKPKIWPIVEEINGNIHVIDCLPPELAPVRCHYWNSSHEVLDRDSGCWVEEVPTVEKSSHIMSYLVVGDKIYAVSTDGFLVFDSTKTRWHANARIQWEDDKPRPFFKDVWDILEQIRVVSCVGGFPYGKAGRPLYVVIALKENSDGDLYAVAYLVNSSGLIVCTQPLIHFFNYLCRMVQGTIIKVEEDKLGKKKTMCSIVTGSPLEWDECNTSNYVLINTFTVEEHPDAVYKVRDIVSEGSEAWPVELEFARVDVMDSYICKTDAELYEGGGDSKDWVKVQACFL